MANWYGSARSNYFAVEDETAFLEWVDTLPGVMAYRRGEEGGLGPADGRW